MYSFCLQFFFLKGNSQVNRAQVCSKAGPFVSYFDMVCLGADSCLLFVFVLALSAFSTPDNPISHWSLVHYSTQPFYLKTCRKLAGAWCHWAWKKYSRSSRRWKNISRGEYPMLMPLLVFKTVPHLFPLQIKIPHKLYGTCRFLISTRKDCTWKIVKSIAAPRSQEEEKKKSLNHSVNKLTLTLKDLGHVNEIYCFLYFERLLSWEKL